jgi:hypothetical protein
MTRPDGSSFANQGDCVSYGAHGGTLVAKSQSQFDCESFGGTFSTGTTPFLWTCRGVVSTGTVDWNQKFDQLAADCVADALAAGFLSSITSAGPLQIPGATDVYCEGLA